MRIVYLPICVCKYLTNITSIRYLPIIPIILKGISYHDELAQKAKTPQQPPLVGKLV